MKTMLAARLPAVNQLLGLFLAALLLAFAATDARALSYDDGVSAYHAKEYDRAYDIWLPLAQQGDPWSQYGLAKLYEIGAGKLDVNDGEALRWYLAAAEGGLPAAKNNLAIFYAEGRSVEKDPARAAALWREAGAAGHILAQYNLGFVYLNGSGVPRDPALAITYFRQAADAGLADAQFTLGEFYRAGEHVPQDSAIARAWYEKAASQGHVGASAEVEKLKAETEAGETATAAQSGSAAQGGAAGTGSAAETSSAATASGSQAASASGQSATATSTQESASTTAAETVAAAAKPEAAASAAGATTTSSTGGSATQEAAGQGEDQGSGQSGEQTAAATPTGSSQTANTKQVPPPSAGSGRSGAYVQLSSLTDAPAAEKEAARLARQYADILGGLAAVVQRADLGAKGIFFRVQVGPVASWEDATNLCSALQARKQDCFVLRR